MLCARKSRCHPGERTGERKIGEEAEIQTDRYLETETETETESEGGRSRRKAGNMFKYRRKYATKDRAERVSPIFRFPGFVREFVYRNQCIWKLYLNEVVSCGIQTLRLQPENRKSGTLI